MTNKKDGTQKKNDFLEAKMYYYNTDALTEKDQVLNSKSSKALPSNEQKTHTRKKAVSVSKTKAFPKYSSLSKNQDKIIERLSGLEDMYKQLIEKLNISKVSIEIEAMQKSNENFENQISMMEQERLTLLEQITKLEAQRVFSIQLEAEKKELKDQVSLLIKENKDSENTINQLRKELTDFSETVAALENKKSIVYLTKEREALEQRISVVMQEKRELYLHIQNQSAENDELNKKIALLDEKVKAVSYLDKKSAMFEEDLKEAEKKNIALSERISAFAEKNGRLNQENKELIKQKQILARQIEDKEDLQKKIDMLGFEINSLLEKNKRLNAENQELMKLNTEKTVNSKVDNQKQLLIDRVDELEQERLHLFKIVGDLEEENKCSPELIEKNDRLYQENEELKNENINAKKQISEFMKNVKTMQAEIIQLKEKRASRLELEQEKGRLQKRIKELEAQSTELSNNITGLNTQISVCQNKNIGFEHLRKEIAKLEEEKSELITQQKEDKAKILELTETILAKNSSENINEEKITALNNENKKISEQIKTMRITQPINYVFDMEKLADLKEFVLESIQTRRWKSTEFVNGAYDAVGLFYRTILQERPIKTKE